MDIYTSFSKLFYFISYLQMVCKEQQPICHYYKESIWDVAAGFNSLKKEHEHVKNHSDVLKASLDNSLAEIGRL